MSTSIDEVKPKPIDPNDDVVMPPFDAFMPPIDAFVEEVMPMPSDEVKPIDTIDDVVMPPIDAFVEEVMPLPSDEVKPFVSGDPSLPPGELDLRDVLSIPSTPDRLLNIIKFINGKSRLGIGPPRTICHLEPTKRTFYPRRKYVQRANTRKIFDLDEFPGLPGAPVSLRKFKDDPALYQKIKEFSEMVLEVYNKKNKGVPYTFVDISKVNTTLASVSVYYITFTAKRPGMKLCTFKGEVSKDTAGRKEVVSVKGPGSKWLYTDFFDRSI